MLKKIRLYGHLRKFGKEFSLAVSTPAEAIRALCTMLPGFKEHLLTHSEPGYRVRVGKEDLKAEALPNPSGGEIIRIIPVVAGAKEGGLTAIIGAILYYVGYAAAASNWYGGAVWGPILSNIGMAMMVGGVAQLLAGNTNFAVQAAQDKGPADTPSYAFSGPHMTTGQGNPIPLGYGRMRVSGALVSIGISPETWQAGGFLEGGAEDGTRSGDGDTTPWVWAVAPAS